MKLETIQVLQGRIELLAGLHIGAGDGEMHIGGTDSPVLKHPYTQEPYIPGSSLKGKMRSLLEWRSGAVQEKPLSYKDWKAAPESTRPAVKQVLQLFGIGGGDSPDEKALADLGPTRLAFWDCALEAGWVERMRRDNLPFTESKSENQINRISGVAQHPRNIERVPAGARFDFRLSIKKLTGDDDTLLHTVLQGLKLLEMDSLGGSGSRGYGKIKFCELQLGDQALDTRFAAIQPFA